MPLAGGRNRLTGGQQGRSVLLDTRILACTIRRDSGAEMAVLTRALARKLPFRKANGSAEGTSCVTITAAMPGPDPVPRSIDRRAFLGHGAAGAIAIGLPLGILGGGSSGHASATFKGTHDNGFCNSAFFHHPRPLARKGIRVDPRIRKHPDFCRDGDVLRRRGGRCQRAPLHELHRSRSLAGAASKAA